MSGVREPVAPKEWSRSELATLAAIFETFVPGGSIRRATIAATALSEAADPDDVRMLRRVLGWVERRPLNLALGGGATRFRDLPADRREEYLLGWARSRIAARRTAFQTLKRLACFLAYADPGADGENVLWARIGYRPAEEAVTPDPPAVRLLAPDLPRDGRPLTLEADVAIVGSGAGGGVVAAALAEAGRDVLVLEAGTYVPESEMPVRELEGYERMYLDRGLAATADLGVAILAGATVGGGTVVNWTTCFAPPDWLRAEWAAGHGLDGYDGPETAADVAALEAELGVAPPPGIPPKDRAILDGATALGYEAGPLRRDAVDCGDCGSCSFGCRRASKRSGPRVHLATASACGARILPRATVARVLLENGRAAGVAGWLAGADGRRVPLTVRARQVVVAAGTLRSPAVLLRSGLAHPAIGANLRLHPVPIIAARMPWPVDMWRGTTQAASCTQFLRPGPRDPSGHGPAHGGFLVESAPGHPGLIAMAFPWERATDHALRMERVRSYAPFIGIVRDTGGGRVRLSRSGRTRIEYRIGRQDCDTARRALVEMARIARAAGATEILALGTPPAYRVYTASGSGEGWDAFLDRLGRFDFSPNRGFLASAHQMGSVRAGADPRTSACDPRGRVRADVEGAVVPGLYVADASLFPTASGVNPMVTVMTLARRVARTVAAEA